VAGNLLINKPFWYSWKENFNSFRVQPSISISETLVQFKIIGLSVFSLARGRNSQMMCEFEFDHSCKRWYQKAIEMSISAWVIGLFSLPTW